jgi:hypothetical protein
VICKGEEGRPGPREQGAGFRDQGAGCRVQGACADDGAGGPGLLDGVDRVDHGGARGVRVNYSMANTAYTVASSLTLCGRISRTGNFSLMTDETDALAVLRITPARLNGVTMGVSLLA